MNDFNQATEFHTHAIHEAKGLDAEGYHYAAYETLQDALKYDPQNAFLWRALGKHHQLVDEMKDAETSFAKAYALRPDNHKIINSYANFFKVTKALPKAVDIYLRAISADTKDTHFLASLGQLYQDMGNFRLAAGCFGRATILDENSDYAMGRYCAIRRDHHQVYTEKIWQEVIRLSDNAKQRAARAQDVCEPALA